MCGFLVGMGFLSALVSCRHDQTGRVRIWVGLYWMEIECLRISIKALERGAPVLRAYINIIEF